MSDLSKQLVVLKVNKLVISQFLQCLQIISSFVTALFECVEHFYLHLSLLIEGVLHLV